MSDPRSPPASFAPPVDRWTALRRGCAGRCPRCNAPEVFRTRVRLHERCPQCGLPLDLEDGWSYGSVPLSYAFACLVWILPVALLGLFGLLPWTAALVLGVLGGVALPILSYRWSKQWWIGLYYAILPWEMNPSEPAPGTDDRQPGAPPGPSGHGPA